MIWHRGSQLDQDPLRLAVQIADGAVVVVDMLGRIVLVNDRLLSATGFGEAALVGQPLGSLFPFNGCPDPRAGFIDRCGSPPETRDLEGFAPPVQVARGDGSTFSAKLGMTSLCSPEHGPVAVVTIRGLRELTLENVGLRGLLESAPDATLVLDGRCHVVLANRRAGELFGMSHADLHEHPVGALVTESAASELLGWLRDRYQDLVGDQVEDGWTTPFIINAVRPDGTQTPVEVSVTGLALDGGMLMRAAVRDVSQRLAMQAEADAMKVNFLATVSHELRTPLTSILGYAELHSDLNDEELPETGRHFVEVISRNARRELRLVDDLLTIVGIGEGDMTIRPALVDLPEVVSQAIEDAQPVAHAAGVELLAGTQGEAALVLGDADRLGQAIDNVLSNAIKFTPQGGRVSVHIRVQPGATREGSRVGSGFVNVEVTDDGPGIDPADGDHIFTRFHRGRAAVAQEKPGVGLGLPIVKAVVEAHGGTVTVDSGAAGGVVFDISLPIARENAAT